MIRESSNNRLLLTATFFLTILLAFNGHREDHFAALFFVISLLSTLLLKYLSLKFFNNIMLVIAGSPIIKITVLTGIFIFAKLAGGFDTTRMAVTLTAALLLVKLFEIKLIAYNSNIKKESESISGDRS